MQARKPDSDKVRRIPVNARAVYLNAPGMSFVTAEKCPHCKAIVENTDMDDHVAYAHSN